MSATVVRTETNEDREGVTFLLAIVNLDQTWVKDVSSPVFVSKSLDHTKWKLVLHPLGNDDAQEECMSLRLVQCDEKGIVVDSELSITNSFETLKNNSLKKCLGWLVHQVTKGEHIFTLRKAEFILSDTLIIRCRIWRKFFEYTDPELLFHSTKIEKISFAWPINDFCRYNQQDKKKMYINKYNFQTPILTFEFFTEGIKENAEIEIISTEYPVLETSYRIAILDRNGKVFKSKNASYSFGEDHSISETFRFPSFITKSELVENNKLCLPMNVLTLQVECFFWTPNVANTKDDHIKIHNLQVSENIPKPEKHCAIGGGIQFSKLSTSTESDEICKPNACTRNCHPKSSVQFFRDMQCMYEEGLFSDCKLVSQGKEFNVHKNVLCYRSPFFRAIFTSPVAENVVPMEDVDPDTLRRVLLFVYSGQMEDLTWERAMRLHCAAVKYALEDLKPVCCSVLKSLLCAANACDILLQSQKDTDLRSVAKDFVVDHLPEIIGTKEWEKLQKGELELEILDLYLKKTKGAMQAPDSV